MNQSWYTCNWTYSILYLDCNSPIPSVLNWGEFWPPIRPLISIPEINGPVRGVIQVSRLYFKAWYVAISEGSHVVVGISTWRHYVYADWVLYIGDRGARFWVRGLELIGFEHSSGGGGGGGSAGEILKFEFLNGWKCSAVPVRVRMSLLCELQDWRERLFSCRVISLSKRVNIQDLLSVHFLWALLSEIPSSALSLVSIS